MHLLKYISDANDIILGLFLDLSKKFDTINHKTFIKINFTQSEVHLMIGSTVISPIDINTQNSIRFDL